MKTVYNTVALLFCLIILFSINTLNLHGQELKENSDLDRIVEKFLEENKGQWYNMNVPESDAKLIAGGCYTTHNVSRRGYYGQLDYLNYIESLKNYETTLNTAGGDMLISYKKTE